MAPGQKVVLGPFLLLLMTQVVFASSEVKKVSEEELTHLSPQQVEEKKQWEANARVERKEFFETHLNQVERKSFVEKQSNQKDEYLRELVDPESKKTQAEDKPQVTLQ